jgi:ABC-type arginine transport system ATPase subunit
VRSVFFGFLGHQSYVTDVPRSSVVKLAVSLTVLNNSLVNSRIWSIRNQSNSVFQFVVFVPHLTSVSNDIRHRSINNNVTWNV